MIKTGENGRRAVRPEYHAAEFLDSFLRFCFTARPPSGSMLKQ
jgi:hypothetical protein